MPPAPSAPASSRMRTDARRNAERIVRAAEQVFIESGTEVTLEEIALRADVGVATTTALLEDLRHHLLLRLHVATTLGYGPRFLHSTGQLHKGGPNTGLFLQLVDTPEPDLAVPGAGYTFGQLIRAQALGDYQALRQKQRRVLRVDLGNDVPGGLRRLTEGVDG